MTQRARSILAVALTVAAAVLLLAGTVALYLSAEVVDEKAFADRAVAALERDELREVVGREIVVNVIDRGSTDLVAARPLLESVVDAALRTEPFQRVLRRAATQANRVFFTREGRDLVLDLGGAVRLVRFGLDSVSPRLAREIPADLETDILRIEESHAVAQAVKVAEKVRLLGWLLPLLALLCFAAAVAVAPRRRVAVLRAGVAAAAAGLVLAIVFVLLENAVVSGLRGGDEVTDQEIQDAGAALLDAYLGDLLGWALAIAVTGLVIAAAAAALEPGHLRAIAESVRHRIVDRPATTWGRVARGVLAILVGIFVALEPTLALQIVAVLAGAALVFFGTAELLLLLQGGRAAATEAGREAERRGRRRTLLAAVGVAVLTVAAAGFVLASALDQDPPETRAAEFTGECNGSRALCDLRLSDIALAGTHNSFSSADRQGWFIANQRRTIRRQLDDGVRLLLLDPHYGVRAPNGRVRTDFAAEQRDRNRVAKALPPKVLEAATRLAGRVGLGGLRGRREVFLCHSVCELGATPMQEALRDIREFLEREPGEVVVLFIEPYVPPREIEREFRRAGLAKYAAELERDEPLPTLREMIESGKRLVVLTEKDADGSVPWYLDGFSLVRDTPLGATRPREFTCRRNRGTADSPIVMLNHWADVFPPRLRANVPVGRRSFLERRVRECGRAFGSPVNFIATDFYDQGDVVEVVRRLNAERARAAS